MSHSENKIRFNMILSGSLPSEVLNLILEENSDIDKYDLARLFLNEFNLLDSKVLPVIWHWKSKKSIRGMSDEQFNNIILIQMKEAGYSI